MGILTLQSAAAFVATKVDVVAVFQAVNLPVRPSARPTTDREESAAMRIEPGDFAICEITSVKVAPDIVETVAVAQVQLDKPVVIGGYEGDACGPTEGSMP
jgi:hypothetical protein